MASKRVTASPTATASGREAHGAFTAEAVAGLAVFLPVLLVLLFVTVEACKAAAIIQALQQGAREAARNLAVAYANHPDLPSNSVEQNSFAFDLVRVHGIINNSAQFGQPTWTNVSGAPGNAAAVVDPALPQTVTVTVNYTPGQYGLPNFPDFDPLHWGSNIPLKATSTYTIQ